MVSVATLTGVGGSKLSGQAHLAINFSCMAFHLETHQSTVLSEFLEVPMP